ncbi:hypothetical protein GGS21DRAFT_486809 [Xylaria nigripes]|nr:hypothetical protein GGS21DRAFT_486809 [Xylaria nigripes]
MTIVSVLVKVISAAVLLFFLSFLIVAVHGLGAHPKYTWTCHASAKGSKEKVHLLELLADSFLDARIISFEYNSDWLIDAPVTTAQQIGEKLLQQLVEYRKSQEQRLPIIFIGHSFGGIVIKQALCRSAEAKPFIQDTSGILFLGTPHQGSPMSFFGNIITWITSLLGSSNGLMLALQYRSAELSDLDSRFDDVRKSLADAKIYSVYEMKPSYIFGYLSLGLIVDRNSAKGPADEAVGVNTDHSGLNKCPSQECEHYKVICGAINKMRERSSLLERGDNQIRDISKKNLNIQRLSGTLLPMSQCYINLTIVQQNSRVDELGRPYLRGSLLEKLDIKEGDAYTPVKLSELFDARGNPDEEVRQPRRILIRGRPGVGKTTLCKKIVYDFIHCEQWNNHFARLFWIPLRKLQGSQRIDSIRALFREEYFRKYEDPGPILDELYRECNKPDAGRSLFLLDGLDEIRPLLSSDHDLHGLVRELINQPNVIVTSRPSVQFLSDFNTFDMELETIGFYPDQVKNYIHHVTKGEGATKGTAEGEGKYQKVLKFLDDHPLIGDLARIPIQLDALCFAWDDVSRDEPQTMTDLYQAIELGLWRKDALLLGKTTSNQPFTPGDLSLVKDECLLLERLAFAGLYDNQTVFDGKFIDRLSSYLHIPGTRELLDETLKKLSFLRSSDTCRADSSRDYYFLHLTLQEYFAARHLKRKWIESTNVELPGTKESLSPSAFLHHHKYSEKYDLVWRFMAGLLDSDPDHQNRFFQTIESQARDLLGPVHRILIMRCLLEVPNSNTGLRQQIEDQLSAWTVSEYRLVQRPEWCYLDWQFLAAHREFPIGLVLKLLRKDDDEWRIHLLRSMHRQHAIISAEIVQLISPWLKNSQNQKLVLAILSCLEDFIGRSSAGHDQTTQKYLENEDCDVLRVATNDVEVQPTPRNVVQAITAKLGDPDCDMRVRLAALNILHNQSNISDAVLGIVFLSDVSLINPDSNIKALPISNEMVGRAAIILEDEYHEARMAAPGAFEIQVDLPKARFPAQRTFDASQSRAILASRHDKGEYDGVWQNALDAPLKQAWPLDARQQQVLTARLEHKDKRVRRTALEFLGNYIIPDDTILQTVGAMLEDEDSEMQWAALKVLDDQSHLPDTILQAVAAKLEDEDSEMRRAALNFLKQQQILSDAIIQAVASHLEDEDSEKRWAALKILQNQIYLPDTIQQAVAAKLEDEEDFKESVFTVLKNESNLQDTIFQAIVARLEDEDKSIKLGVLAELKNQAYLQDRILQAVATKLEDEHQKVRRNALSCLERSKLPDSALQSIGSIFKSWVLSELGSEGDILLRILMLNPKLIDTILKTRDLRKGLSNFLLQQSLERHIVWYHCDNKLHLVINESVFLYEGENVTLIVNEIAPSLLDQSMYDSDEEVETIVR